VVSGLPDTCPELELLEIAADRAEARFTMEGAPTGELARLAAVAEALASGAARVGLGQEATETPTLTLEVRSLQTAPPQGAVIASAELAYRGSRSMTWDVSFRHDDRVFAQSRVLVSVRPVDGRQDEIAQIFDRS
jgi:acyl-coenzyme A thioesterase PaaI-like protein